MPFPEWYGGGFALSDGFAVVGRYANDDPGKAVDGFDGGIVVGFSLMVALLLSFAPDEALNSIPALIRPIVGNGLSWGHYGIDIGTPDIPVGKKS